MLPAARRMSVSEETPASNNCPEEDRLANGAMARCHEAVPPLQDVEGDVFLVPHCGECPEHAGPQDQGAGERVGPADAGLEKDTQQDLRAG